jgi:hypothetical protein
MLNRSVFVARFTDITDIQVISSSESVVVYVEVPISGYISHTTSSDHSERMQLPFYLKLQTNFQTH